MMQIAVTILKQCVTRGQIRVIIGDRKDILIGAHNPPLNTNPKEGEKHRLTTRGLAIWVRDARALYRLIMRPDPAIGELYMDEKLKIVEGSFDEFMDFMFAQVTAWQNHPLTRMLCATRGLVSWAESLNPVKRSKHNVAHHYDLTDQLFELFLDENRQYSCAYFHKDEDSLKQAQRQKIARLIAKLNLHAEHKVLDIGCGWGGMMRAISRVDKTIAVKGITLSENQFAYIKKYGQKQCSVALCDYRQLGEEKFDRIISVGMLEHVGKANLKRFFKAVAHGLTEDGVAVIHAIGRFGKPMPTSPWLQKYIFPGGYLPTMTQIMQAVDATGLFITDVEIMRLHYAKTLRKWGEAFEQNKHKLKAPYDETFMRMWRFYLKGSENYFRFGHGMVFQIQLAKQQKSVPLSRQYIHEMETKYMDKLWSH